MLLRSIQWNDSIKFPLEETLKCSDASQLWAHNPQPGVLLSFPISGEIKACVNPQLLSKNFIKNQVWAGSINSCNVLGL